MKVQGDPRYSYFLSCVFQPTHRPPDRGYKPYGLEVFELCLKHWLIRELCRHGEALSKDRQKIQEKNKKTSVETSTVYHMGDRFQGLSPGNDEQQ